jgi:hypothetical protein
MDMMISAALDRIDLALSPRTSRRFSLAAS